MKRRTAITVKIEYSDGSTGTYQLDPLNSIVDIDLPTERQAHTFVDVRGMVRASNETPPTKAANEDLPEPFDFTAL